MLIDLGAQNGPRNAPTSSPRGSQDALGARLPLEAVSGAILGSLLAPPEHRKSCSRLGEVLIFATIAYGAREPKIDPKTSPKWSPKPPPEASKRLKLSIQDGASFLSKFQLKFERFGDPQMAPKITQNLLWRHLGASWRPPGPPGPPPEASRRPSESDFRAQNATKPCKIHGLLARSTPEAD